MTQTMHDETQAALAALALDALDGAERERALVHVAECARCSADLAALRDTAAGLAWAAPQGEVDAARCAAIRTRLVARAAADPRSARGGRGEGMERPSLTLSPRAEQPTIVRPPRGGRLSRSGWLAAAASVVAAASVAGLAAVSGDRDALRAQLALQTAQAESLRAVTAEQAELASAVSGPSVRVIELAAAGRREAGARMFWNRATHQWTLVAHDLPPLASGRSYQLWLVTATEKISAGTFAPDPRGRAIVRATYPLPPEQLAAIAVTEEPAGGVPQPTGPMVIVGTAG